MNGIGTLLRFGATQLLKKAGQEELNGAVKWVVEGAKGASIINFTSPNASDEINKIVNIVQDIQKTLGGLEHQLKDTLLQLQKDDLNKGVNTINTYYQEMLDILIVCSTPVSQRERAIKDKDPNYEMEDLLTRCRDELPGICNWIHNVLIGKDHNPFLLDAANKMLSQSADFIAFYIKMKTFIFGYWYPMAKAIVLLDMANQNQRVEYSTGSAAIKLVKAHVEEEEQYLVTVVGIRTIELAEKMLGKKKTATYIRLLGKDSRKPLFQEDEDLWIASQGAQMDYHKWFIEPCVSLENPNVSIGEKYPMYLVQSWTGWSPNLIDSGWGSSRGTYPSSANRWLIRPREPGSDLFTLQFQSNHKEKDMDGQFWDIREEHNQINPFGKGFLMGPVVIVGPNSKLQMDHDGSFWKIMPWKEEEF